MLATHNRIIFSDPIAGRANVWRLAFQHGWEELDASLESWCGLGSTSPANLSSKSWDKAWIHHLTDWVSDPFIEYANLTTGSNKLANHFREHIDAWIDRLIMWVKSSFTLSWIHRPLNPCIVWHYNWQPAYRCWIRWPNKLQLNCQLLIDLGGKSDFAVGGFGKRWGIWFWT